jgi:hypothetical protein
MNLQLVRQPLGLRGREGFVQRRRRVGVQVVHHQHDALRLRIVDVDQGLHALRPVEARAMRADLHIAPALQRLAN